MIGWLRGRLVRRSLPDVLLDVGGVGYEVCVPLGTFGELPGEGETVELEVLTVVRAESLQLFGFRTSLEKQVFSTLLGVSGVGPKLALAVLSALEPEELAAAVGDDRPAVLERVPGIGRKTAQRLVLELKDRLPSLAAVAHVAAGEAGEARVGPLDTPSDDAVAALVNLGYRRPEAERAVGEVFRAGEALDLAELIRAALRRLGGGR